MLIHSFLINSAQRFPDKEAIVHAGRRYTYTEVLETSNAIANWLQSQNLSQGFRAGILSDDPFEYITSYFGSLMAGGIAVGFNTQTSARSLQAILNDCTPAVLFLQPRFRKYLQALSLELKNGIAIVLSTEHSPVDTNVINRTDILGKHATKHLATNNLKPADLAQIIYTSGTTGAPKGVMLRHANLVANTRSIIHYLELTEKDRVMAVLPFFYSYGNSVFLTHIAVGGTLVVNQSFLYPNVILDEMVAERVTGFSGVPSTFAILLHRSAIANYSFPDLRYLTQAGAAMSPILAKKLQRIFQTAAIYIMYGQTEASARLSYLSPKHLDRKAGSIGKAIPDVTLHLLDKSGAPVRTGEIGEIVAQGENIMAGYWNNPVETEKVLRPEGLWTGDLARMDEGGYFFIVSRKSDMIKSGSHRIAPKEIEEIILEHEAVHEVAVVGCEDEILGEAIRACVVLKPGKTCSEKELTLHCKRNLPAFKVPHQVEFHEELPKTSSGKIKRHELAQGRQI